MKAIIIGGGIGGLSVALAFGPRVFSLPYRYGRISYQNDWSAGELCGRVDDAGTGAALAYQADLEMAGAQAETEAGPTHPFPCPHP